MVSDRMCDKVDSQTLYGNIREECQFKKIVCKVVPTIQCGATYKNQCMAALSTLLNAYEKDCDTLLDRIITGDETRA